MDKIGLKLFPLIFLGVLAIYLWFPTKNYYWDGIAFAQAIEDATKPGPSLLHPNHLVYNVTGYLIYKVTQTIGIPIRALQALQVTNSILSVLTAYLFFRILVCTLGSVYLSGLLIFLFSFSATWWRFSTDANSYIASVFFLLVCFFFLVPGRQSKPILAAIIHSVSMLFHQLAVFFYPVILLGLFHQTVSLTRRQRLQVLLQYSLVAFLITLSAYYYGFYLAHGALDPKSFARWITSYSPEVSFSLNLWGNLITTARGHVQLFLGGRLSLVRYFVEPVTIISAFVLLALLVVLSLKVIKNFGDIKLFFAMARKCERRFKPLMRLAILWAAVYLIFLFFWLPHNTFYRLFYLPALIILLGIFLARFEAVNSSTRQYRAALIVAAIAISNWIFLIFPYSHIEANKPLLLALDLRRSWPQRTVIYYATFSSDDWTFKYFNPMTTWRKLDLSNLANIEDELQALYKNGGTAWFDTTAIDLFLSQSEEFKKWLYDHTKGQPKHELVNDKHRIRFFRVFPASAQGPESRRPLSCGEGSALARRVQYRTSLRFAGTGQNGLEG